jgi:hypothetical protein
MQSARPIEFRGVRCNVFCAGEGQFPKILAQRGLGLFTTERHNTFLLVLTRGWTRREPSAVLRRAEFTQ